MIIELVAVISKFIPIKPQEMILKTISHDKEVQNREGGKRAHNLNNFGTILYELIAFLYELFISYSNT
jgi:hypothetical protein